MDMSDPCDAFVEGGLLIAQIAFRHTDPVGEISREPQIGQILQIGCRRVTGEQCASTVGLVERGKARLPGKIQCALEDPNIVGKREMVLPCVEVDLNRVRNDGRLEPSFQIGQMLFGRVPFRGQMRDQIQPAVPANPPRFLRSPCPPGKVNLRGVEAGRPRPVYEIRERP